MSGKPMRRLGIAVVAAVTAVTAFSASAPDHRPSRSHLVASDRPPVHATARSRSGGGDVALLPSAGERVIAPPPEHFDAPPARSTRLPDQLRRFVAGERRPGAGVWALIVGIDDYPGTRSDLRSAVADADTLDQALEGFGVAPDRRVVLRDADASADAIGIGLDWLVANAKPDATAVFLYAGHARRLSSTRHAIVGADGVTITDAALRDRLSGLRAAKTWIAIAACYGGGFDELATPGRLLTAAADANHLAYENQAFGNSYMVEFMVQRAMTEGAAPTSVQAAFDYAKSTLDRDYPNRAPVAVDAGATTLDLRQSSYRPHASGAAPPRSGSPPPDRGDASKDNGAQDPSDPSNEDGCAALTLGVVRCQD